ncbi:Protein hgh1 [Dimargaris verticillata]|uniref:Protein HGH1 homolog n=1 Tax=Dimargaris verticillata TaxID=2761393 RepID=A0A9W8B3T0_9FUNG|nr:Protein hgh1 [Dimargaris verticillata]
MEAQLDELIGFLKDPKPEVRQIAAQYLVGFTSPKSDNYPLIKTKFSRLIPDLLAVCRDHLAIRHQALLSLINLSGDDDTASYFNDAPFLTTLGALITDPTSPMADMGCMLLANISKHEAIAHQLLNISSCPPSPLRTQPDSEAQVPLVDQLTSVFARGMDRQYNEHADFNFLANVFGNLTSVAKGREFFLTGPGDNLADAPLTKLIVFADHAHLVRRTGVLSTIKNCCFESDKHDQLLDEDGINLLPYILLPLCGPEEFSEEDMEGMPDDLQLLPEDKQREPQESLRKILVEILVLFTARRAGREYLRQRKVYPVVRTMHTVETSDEVGDAIDRLVQMLMRDEAPKSDDQVTEASQLDNEIQEL